MNKTFYTSFLFLGLLFLQVFVLDNILFLDFINPYLYVAFVIFYPLKKERYSFLFLCFLLGLFIDLFSNSGGIHAFSLLFIAYIRLFLVRLIFKKTEQDYLLFNLFQESFGKVFNYVVTLILVHHFILFSLANFSSKNTTTILTNTLYSGIFTSILFFVGSYVFRFKK